MTDDMVERVARALMREASDDPDADKWCSPRPWYGAARAAIEAMREPTGAMIDAGRWPAEDDGTLACWRAMIDAVLSSPAKEPMDEAL